MGQGMVRLMSSARSLLRSAGAGGSVMRRLLPVTGTILVVLAYLRWQGEQQGLYGSTVGLILMTSATLVIVTGLLWFFASGLDRDEAARVKAEDALVRTSRYFELSHDLVCTAGFDGFFQELNAAWTETLGWTEAELRSRPFVEFVHPDDREATERESAGLAVGGVTVDFVNRYATKDGGWRWIDWRAVSIVEEGLIYASARDVTERRATETALEASERQTRQILETAHDAFISIDADGLVTGWNPQAEASFGWSRDEMLGRELAAIVIPESDREAHRAGLARFLATGEGSVLGRRLELTALHRDGHEFPVEITISPLETDSGFSFHAFLRDISQRKHDQEQLARARDQALEASSMKSMFVANVSHEIRTPMNGVIGMSELLLDTELDEVQREYVETICSSGESLLTIIDDILDFSKIEAGKLQIDPTECDLRDTVERACAILAGRAHEKGLELAVSIGPEVPALVHADAARLRQVVANLVSNAIKFTADGEVVLRVSSRPDEGGAALVRVDVEDTGIGIEHETLAHLFQPYAQADGSTTRRYGGTGLGLAISRQLVELMGGSLEADSNPGQGSCFWFTVSLPLAEAGDRPPEEEREIAGLRVLVVDDNATNRKILERQLTSWRVSCEVADSAEQAMVLLAAAARDGSPYALALLDLNMPDVDGLALARGIRAQPALDGLRLILLTSSGVRADAPGEVALDGRLSKPVRQTRLYEEIQAVMAGERSATRRSPSHMRESGVGHRDDAPSILVVEDTPVNQVVAARMLEKIGYHADVADNGVEALAALSERSYAAILMDCQMPELDGYQTTTEVRLREQPGRRIPIIAMTANSMQGERERCLAAGMDDYLSKPLRSQALKEVLARWAPQPSVGPTQADGMELADPAVIAELGKLDSDVLTDLISMYFDQAAAHVVELSGAIERGEPAVVAQISHRLKGSSGTLGAARVSQVASELEETAKACDLSAAHELLDRLQAALGDTRAAVGGLAATI